MPETPAQVPGLNGRLIQYAGNNRPLFYGVFFRLSRRASAPG